MMRSLIALQLCKTRWTARTANLVHPLLEAGLAASLNVVQRGTQQQPVPHLAVKVAAGWMSGS
jgi:hypothetical protein